MSCNFASTFKAFIPNTVESDIVAEIVHILRSPKTYDHVTSDLSDLSRPPTLQTFIQFYQVNLVSSESSCTRYNLLLTDEIATLKDYTSCLIPVIIIRGSIHSPSLSKLPFYGLVSRISDSFWQLRV